jgi:serine/threonine-protein kinase
VKTVALDPLVGATVAGGRYQVLRLLGAGGMGAVYLARQVAMDRMVALKLIAPQAEAHGQEVVQRFHQEMRASAKIEHPNTIRVYDFGETDGRLFLAMEYLEGRTLRRVLGADGPLPTARVIRIAIQIAKALGAAHEEGIVHRDLKPENVVLLDRYGDSDFVKVLDFGIARSLDATEQRMTATGAVIGTPAYMAPEQAAGRTVDGRTDLYALGVMLYEMVTGALPFTKPTAIALLVAHTTEPPPPVQERAPALPPRLAALIMRLLAKDPVERPASATELLGLLEREALPATPHAAPPTVAAVTEPAPVVTEPLPVTTKRPPPVTAGGTASRRAWKIVATAAALAVVVAGILGFILYRRQSQDRALRAARLELEQRLENMGEPPPPPECATRDLFTAGRLVGALDALHPKGGGAGDPRAALALLTEGEPRAAEQWAMLARAHDLAGDDAAAFDAARSAVALCPGYAAAHNTLGKAAQRSGRTADAEAGFRRAIALREDYLPPRFNLGLLQLKQRDSASAIATLSEVIRRAPDHPHAFLVRGQAQLLAGDTAKALADLKEAVQRDPRDADAWMLLGHVRAQRGDAEEATAAFCRAREFGVVAAAARCPPSP